MSIYTSIIPALLLSAAVLSVACDPINDEATPHAKLDEFQVDDPRVIASLRAVGADEAHTPEFWLDGLASGSVELGGWACIPPAPPPPPGCGDGFADVCGGEQCEPGQSLPIGWVCQSNCTLKCMKSSCPPISLPPGCP